MVNPSKLYNKSNIKLGPHYLDAYPLHIIEVEYMDIAEPAQVFGAAVDVYGAHNRVIHRNVPHPCFGFLALWFGN